MAIGLPWWDIFPKTPTEAIKATLETPTIAAGGAAATVFKSITKTTGVKLGSALLGVGGGLVLGSLLTGGGKQEQEQEAVQDLAQQQLQEQRQRQQAAMRDMLARTKQTMAAYAAGKAAAEVHVPIAVAPVYDIVAGGAVDIGGVTTQTDTTTTTINVTGLTQEAVSTQIGQMLTNMQLALQSARQAPIITQTQEATQEGGMNWLLVGAAALGAYLIFGRRKSAR